MLSIPASSHVKVILNSAVAKIQRGGTPQQVETDLALPSTPVWLWDHYRYNPQNSTQKSSNEETSDTSRNLLIVQVVAAPHSPEWRTSLFQFGEISSRPNRAYARQWGRNFVRYTAPPDPDGNNSNIDYSQQCDGVDHVVVLNAILDRQQPRTLEERDTIPYDALVLLPPDAIITDLDYDLLSMIPDDKLLSVVGCQKGQQHSGGVVFWNLRHELTHVVAEHLWSELVEPQQDESDRPQTCAFQQSYVKLLLDRVLPSVLKDDAGVQSVVGNLDETKDGFVFVGAPSLSGREIDATGNIGEAVPSFCLKCFPPNGSLSTKTSQLLSDPDATRVTLQTTADAVCYRYYPKCEVL